ncbi:ATP-dependent DNA helicase RecG [Candidatus Saccharibacteria bacterium]|nr:ATP-dependent DNA helicase RecG [Candidatus Saccharibacteria bacterium]
MNLSLPLRELSGVGDKLDESFHRVGLRTVKDLVHYLPRTYDDYTQQSRIVDLKPGKVTIVAKVESVETRSVRRGMRITTAVLADDSSKLKAVWFNQPYRATQLKTGERYMFTGTFEFSYNRYQITNPGVEQAKKLEQTEGERIVPVYRSIRGVKPPLLRKLVASLRPTITMLGETLPLTIVESQKLMSNAQSHLALHFPESQEQIAQARERVGFEELFELLLASQLNKQANNRLQGWKLPFDVAAAKEFVAGLPFALTNAQRRAAWQIIQDFESEIPMNRLLQGDVGSGKTAVAGFAARQAAQAGYQSAIMAPTEILASQHAETLSALLAPFDVSVGLLTGSVKGKARQELLSQISDGTVDIIVGTHALIQKKVEYHKLGFVVIDEQHRFGVAQRQALLDKSIRMPHLLAMTATPIPRSLALTVYGELDVSVLDELPSGRKPIATKLWAPTNTEKLYEAVDDEIAKGRQCYIICSLIDEDPENDVKSVEAEYKKLKSTVFNHRKVGLLHGKLAPVDKDAVMQQFADGDIDILVSTTVVEVGVNVPNSTVMIIENADRFGLSQLHQLRGRVGRSTHQSYCYLVMSDSSKPSARLREIEKSQDGFYLAEVDLKLRGPGEIYGRSQHGALNLQVASLGDTKLIARAQAAAKEFLSSGDDLLQYKQLATRVEKNQRLTTLN